MQKRTYLDSDIVRVLAVFTIGLTCGLFSSVLLACDIEVESVVVPTVRTGDYDPFSSDSIILPLEVRLYASPSHLPPTTANVASEEMTSTNEQNAQVEDCVTRLQLIARSGALTSASGDRLEYRIESRDRPASKLTDGGLSLIASVPVNSSRIYRFFLEIPPQQMVPYGNYQSELTVRVLNDSELSTSTINSFSEIPNRLSRTLSMGVQVNEMASIEFAGTSQTRMLLDLGTLNDSAATVVPISIRARSTVPFQLRLSSENKGMLLRENSTSDGIAYELLVDGAAVSLEQNKVVSFNEALVQSGQSIPIQVAVPAVRNRRAGVYLDTVSVKIFPAMLLP